MVRHVFGSAVFSRVIRVFAIAAFAIPVLAFAQITDVTSMTATPIPGVGHDYLHDMNEIVSPANGSVSVRIAAPTPHERGMNFPIYAYTYDSNGQFTLQMYATPTGCGNPNNGPYECTGANVYGPNVAPTPVWPSFPGAVNQQNISLSFNLGPNNGSNTCSYVGNWIYVDLAGGRHNLNLNTSLENQQGAGCGYFGVGPQNSGGDNQFNWGYSPSTGALSIIDNHGDLLGGGLKGGEDTNGNYRNGTGRPWSVTYGTGAQLYNPLSMTVPGYATPYTYTYENAPASFTGLNSTLVSSQSSGTCIGSQSGGVGSLFVLQQLNLPNGQYYKFGYDPVYGLLNSITYPTGATVTYTWDLNAQSEMTGYVENSSIGAPVNNPSICYFIHDWPAITKRVVSFDGVTAALQQTFSYTTNWSIGGANPFPVPYGPQWWTSKTTTVTTTDLLRPGQPSYQTIYTYTAYLASPQPPTSTAAASEIPLESTVVYKDTSGSTLRTVIKVWDMYIANELDAECSILPNGQTSGKFYTYEPGTNQVTDLQEFDFGSVTSSCQNPQTTPARETKTTYASLGNTPYWPSGQYMSDRPSAVAVYDHGTRVSETDYSYDQTSVASVSPAPVGHDEAVYGASAAAEPRGNVTTITKQCFTASGSCKNSVTTLAYDETGQVLSVTDPRGFTTLLSYTDSYTTDDGSPPGNTNTYLTKLTRPTTNGVAHVSNYQYDYEKGELRVATDENQQVSKYHYDDPWNRLTESVFPDGGQKSITYDDAGPTPTVTTSTLLNSSGTAETSTTTMDGVGHVLSTELTSDPSGTDTVQNTYDGNGRLWTKTNPYRGTSPPPNTTTTYYYDALGRPIETSEQDGSILQWCYDDVASKPAVANCSAHLGSVATGTWVDSTDEKSNHWQRTSDSFDRLTEVMEPSGASMSPSMETDYTYDMLNNLRSVNQWGGPSGSSGARTRSFNYDSLSRLLTGYNPETGTISYTYLANGSLCASDVSLPCSKTDARGITTSYNYDALNRILSKTYSSDAGSTPFSCYQYDASTNGIGRLTSSWTQSVSAGSCPATAPTTGFVTKRSTLAYDSMGRAWSDVQCTLSVCQTANPCPTSNGNQSYGYDLVGNLTCFSNGVPSTPGTTSAPLTFTLAYDAAARLQSITSNWNDSTHPPNLFSAQTSQNPPCGSLATTGYAAFGALMNASFGNGLTLNRNYDTRLRIACEIDTGAVATQ